MLAFAQRDLRLEAFAREQRLSWRFCSLLQCVDESSAHEPVMLLSKTRGSLPVASVVDGEGTCTGQGKMMLAGHESWEAEEGEVGLS